MKPGRRTAPQALARLPQLRRSLSGLVFAAAHRSRLSNPVATGRCCAACGETHGAASRPRRAGLSGGSSVSSTAAGGFVPKFYLLNSENADGYAHKNPVPAHIRDVDPSRRLGTHFDMAESACAFRTHKRHTGATLFPVLTRLRCATTGIVLHGILGTGRNWVRIHEACTCQQAYIMHAYIQTHAHTHTHTYTHTCMYVCMHACMHACIHTSIHTY